MYGSLTRSDLKFTLWCSEEQKTYVYKCIKFTQFITLKKLKQLIQLICS